MVDFSDEVVRIRAALAEAAIARQSLRDTCVALDKHNDELEAEIARLRAELADAREILNNAYAADMYTGRPARDFIQRTTISADQDAEKAPPPGARPEARQV